MVNLNLLNISNHGPTDRYSVTTVDDHMREIHLWYKTDSAVASYRTCCLHILVS